MPKQKSEHAQGWRVWFLLAVVIQLTILARWVKFSRSPVVVFADSDDDDTTTTALDQDDNDPCNNYKTCGACTFSHFQYFSSTPMELQSHSSCHWCSLSSTCYSSSKQPKDYCLDPQTNASAGINRQYDCPLGPVPYPEEPPSFLPNWMGSFYEAGILDTVRLTDLSLPGSHDSLSYDLSLTVSEDGIDNLRELAKLLHTLSGGMVKILPGDLEEFFRMQAKTQQLTLRQQLDNGIRFFDIRIMWEPDKKEWFSIHFMQSKQHAVTYLREIRQWLDEHPQEVVVIWLSKHGSTTATGGNQYPGVSPEQKQQFWDRYCHIFDGLMQATNETSIFSTSLGGLIERNHRVITYASDYAEFTQNSHLAENAAFIQNAFDNGEGVFQEEDLLQSHVDYFKNASVNNAYINEGHGFTLLAMNTASPSWQVIAAAKHQFLHWLTESQRGSNLKGGRSHDHSHVRHQPKIQDAFRLLSMLNGSPLWRVVSDITTEASQWMQEVTLEKEKEAAQLQADLFSSCPSHIKIPGVDHWCPKNLMDISQLSSYYNQIAIEEAYQNCFDDDGNATRHLAAFPNAFYLDTFDYDGTVRVGPQLMDGSERGDMTNNVATKDAKYALVDTLLAYNARVACSRRSVGEEGCDAILDTIYERRSRYPFLRWSEPDVGRHADWPPYSYAVSMRSTRPGMDVDSII